MLEQEQNRAADKPFANGWRKRVLSVSVAVAMGASIGLGAWIWVRAPGDLLATALGPVAVMPDAGADDGSGGDVQPADSSESFLGIPQALQDERVVAAISPIARLSCRKDDPENVLELDERQERAAQRARALAAPLAPAAATDDVVASGALLAAAGVPIARVPTATVSDEPPAQAAAVGCPALLNHTFSRLQNGQAQSLCQFEGKVLLVVNTASYCAYTKQYEALEAMYRKYKDRGLVVVGFPSNDFNQEPGSNKDIAEFCRTTYGVQFPMFEKTSVASIAANPLFKDLAAATGNAPEWNFHKYVIDRSGHPVASFKSAVTPQDRDLTTLIERLLKEAPAPARG